MSLLEKVEEAGIIGAGGAGFPTHVKLASRAEYILLNGAECEPLLRVDQQLMAIFSEEIIKGFEAAGRAIEAKKAIIGIKGKHKEAIRNLEKQIEILNLTEYVQIGILPDMYPAGDEQVLVYELTGRVVPEGSIPGKVGCVVINSETALNIYYALDGKPVTEKYITIAGDVRTPITVKVPVGTPIREVLLLSGIESLEQYAVIDGGPMMGSVLKDLNGYVTKKNKGFIILKKDHPLIRKKTASKEQMRRINRASCEQCRMCTDLCPRFLLGHGIQPHKMVRALAYDLQDLEGQSSAQLCCQCNLCELFSCHAGLYPKAANNYYREKTTEQGLRYKPTKECFEAQGSRRIRAVSSKRLIARLGLCDYDRPAPIIEEFLQPKEVHIATRQHVGVAVTATVVKGQHVEVGQVLGNITEGQLGAKIHASISGTVTFCGSEYITIRGI